MKRLRSAQLRKSGVQVPYRIFIAVRDKRPHSPAPTAGTDASPAREFANPSPEQRFSNIRLNAGQLSRSKAGFCLHRATPKQRAFFTPSNAPRVFANWPKFPPRKGPDRKRHTYFARSGAFRARSANWQASFPAAKGLKPAHNCGRKSAPPTRPGRAASRQSAHSRAVCTLRRRFPFPHRPSAPR